MKRVLLLVLVLLHASCAKIEAEQGLGQTPDSGTSTDTDTDGDTDADSDTDADTDTDTDTDTSPVECDDSEDCGGDPCVDGYCCNDACDGACEACDVTGFEGTCTSYPDGLDPEDDCSDAGPSSCGETGVCNGVSGCEFYPSGVVCDDLEPCTSDDQCDGLGTCAGLVPTDCDPGAGNECCAGACSTTAGCYTVDDGCDDNCGTNNITKSENCLGCGPAQGVGICSGGSVHTCNDFSHILCEEVSCDGTTYYCTNDGGSWEWRSLVLCDDGDDCTVSDACWGGSCIGTVYTCPSDDCTTRACDGLGACIETHEPVTTLCGTITCPVDNCALGSWWDYPPSCDSYCDGAGTCVDCTCTAAETVCVSGSVCCEAACLDVGGCFTVTGTCGTGDVCTDSNILYVDSVCSGCGPMGADGFCGGGGTFICDDTQHNSCEIVSCGGTTHYCTNVSGNWQWELTPDCDDGDLCTYEDTCGAGGTCLGTPITCTDTDCLSSTCDGTENCFEVPMTVAETCGTTTCMADYCSAGSWYNYPPDCTSYCDGIGSCDTCTCTAAATVCDVGATNECCLSVCNPVLGCGTNPGNCDGTDECTDPTTLVTEKSCLGCSLNLANGVCGNGTSHVCDSSASCDVVTCDSDTYYCTNFGGTWEWRLGNNQCNDGNPCTYGDYCDSGSCSGTPITCVDDDCIDRSCNGTMSCTEVNLPVTTACDTTDCASDYCSGGDWYQYPATCTNYCDGAGTCDSCSCTAAPTTCDVGPTNECCLPQCDSVAGCSTTPGDCASMDECSDPTQLVTGKSCSSCGPNGAEGICVNGSTANCDAAHSCDEVICGGSNYICTNAGGTWEWRFSATCNDGDNCTWGDTCGSGICSGTTVTCTSDDCVSRTCNGTSTCTEVNEPVTTSCGTTSCPADFCGSGDWYDYPGTCTSYCNGTGTCNPCTCSTSTTACNVGSTNVCCIAECNAVSGCSTVAGSCGGSDVCTATTLTVGQSCNGCGANLANGICGSGAMHTCNATNECDVQACDGTTYYCTNVGAVWEWRVAPTCNDGDLCTYGDSCGSGTCSGTTITCDDTDCIDRTCNGTSTCTVVNNPPTTPCGTIACGADYCNAGTWYNYPATCTSYCSGTGTCNSCSCSTSTTACSVGSSNQCCVAGCDPVAGCSTSAGDCSGGDVCGPTTLSTGLSCLGCGANNANGVCGNGTNYTCNATNDCDVISCGGTVYFCTNAGGTWEWRLAPTCDDGDLCTYGDTCGGGTCSGTAVACNSPWPDECVSNVLWSYYSPGTCSGGTCSYPHTATACDDPPADTCVGNTAWNYNAAGTCVVDHCVYSHTETVCPHTCNLGVCEGCAMGSNVAPSATGSISAGSTDQVTYGPGRLNDGGLQSGCGFCWIFTGTSYGGGAYFQYTWGTPQNLWGMWVDTEPSYGSGCAYTTNRGLEGGDVQWWNGSTWVTDGTVTGQTDDWTYYEFTSPVTTTKIRIFNAYAMSQDNAVIFEWEVYTCL